MSAGFVTSVTFCHVLSRVTRLESVTSVTRPFRGVTSVTKARIDSGAATGRPSPEQTLFLARINQAGGLGFIARNCRDVAAALGQAP